MSVYQDIRRAVRQVLLGLDLEQIGANGDAVRLRKRPAYFKEHDPLPLIVVSPLRRENGQQTFGGAQIVRYYPVQVTLLYEQGVGVEGDDWIETAYTAVEKALSVTSLTGASTVFGYEFQPDGFYDLSALAAYFDVAALGFVYWSQEATNT